MRKKRLWSGGIYLGLGEIWNTKFKAYSFKDDAPAASRPKAQTIHVEHWDNQPNYMIDWKYEPSSNTYLRVNGGKPHNDRNSGKQIRVKNVIALFMTEGRANDGYEGNLHMLYGTKGSGKAQIFQDGKVIDGRWKKDTRTSRTILTANGKEVKFTRGTLWFHILPLDGVVEVQ